MLIESIFSDVPREKLQHVKDRPIMAAALDPDYHRNGNKEYVCGGRAEEIGLVKKGQEKIAKNWILLKQIFFEKDFFLVKISYQFIGERDQFTQ